MFLLSSNVYSNFHRLDFSANNTEEEIALHGSLSNGPLRSVLTTPFEATKSADVITVAYLVNLSNIQVSVTDESGQLVYNNNVNPVSGGQLLIDIVDYEPGDYTITFSNATGGYLYGTFEVSE
jgi:hypothetical protein